jgi:DNA-binding transcriptional regulator YiaG
VKRIQCTGCGQVFWTELQLDESLVSSGEWIESPCPKCGAKWAIVEPGKGMAGEARAKTRRKVKRTPRRQARPRRTVQAKGERTPIKKEAGPPSEEKALTWTPARILGLRKKLNLTQKELGSLAEVDRGSILGWEKGKFKPGGKKVAQLAALAMKGKEEVKKLLGKKIPE